MIWNHYLLTQDISGQEFTVHVNCASSGQRSFIAVIFIGGHLVFSNLFQVQGSTFKPYPSPFTFISDSVVTASAGESVALQILIPLNLASSGSVLWGTGVDSYIEIPGPNPTEVDDVSDNILPNEFFLFQNYPNPFNPETTIKYQLPSNSDVKLEIYNLLGQRVATLVDKQQEAGNYSLTWNGKEDSGKDAASGIYLYRLQTEDFVQARKLTLFRR